jgi:hypothetical protein
MISDGRFVESIIQNNFVTLLLGVMTIVFASKGYMPLAIVYGILTIMGISLTAFGGMVLDALYAHNDSYQNSTREL